MCFFFHFSSLCFCELEQIEFDADFTLHIFDFSSHSLVSLLPQQRRMKHFTPEQKHEILLEYSPRSPTHSFPALASRHAVAGGAITVKKWFARWDGSIPSLQRKEGSGRPHILTDMEVQRHITAPIRRLNRSARQVRYRKVAEAVREKTGKQISDRSVRRIGREELGAKKTRGTKRTAEECKCTHT